MMSDNNQGVADIAKIKRWSPVWIVPIVTALIGLWIIFYHFNNQGPEVTLITTNAEGIQAGKTAIKSRSVDIGTVETVMLSEDLGKVIITARLNSGMNKLLRKDSVFWVVKPQIGKEGVSGLGTLLSGAYIELQPGRNEKEEDTFALLDSPPLASQDEKGLRVSLESKQSGQLSAGDPVLFRGFRVGSVESSIFDPSSRVMRYQLFISAPYQGLVTTNVRFWQDSGVSFDMSAEGMRVDMGSIATLFSGGVSFDVPEGWALGTTAENNAEYVLFSNKKSIQDSLFTNHEDVLMLFSDSVRGLQPGAPVEFRGIRLGTVAEVPFFMPEIERLKGDDYRIPVLVRIEPDRIDNKFGKDLDIKARLLDSEKDGLRASLKSANLLTGALYIDLDFYPNSKAWIGPKSIEGYPVMPTESSGFAQIQQKVMQTLDKFNSLPLNSLLGEVEQTLKESQNAMKEMQATLNSVNKIAASPEMQNLPKDLQKTLLELNRSMKGFQPGSPAYNKMVGDMQRLDQVLRELQPVLRTLNEKSNSLVFEASVSEDPKPKKAKK